ncbi:MAG TPA: hypothetical protein PKA10_18130 [Selenomonadales bacterium]|nr:hypothetical protein [Selenomonadales bacterium]
MEPLPEFTGLPFTGHELFRPLWDSFADRYNLLADTLNPEQIRLLQDTLAAVENLERLRVLYFLEAGVNHVTGRRTVMEAF